MAELKPFSNMSSFFYVKSKSGFIIKNILLDVMMALRLHKKVTVVI